MTSPASSHTDRQRVIEAVKAALAAGHISGSEWEARLTTSYVAETDLEYTQYLPVLKLPPPPEAEAPPSDAAPLNEAPPPEDLPLSEGAEPDSPF